MKNIFIFILGVVLLFGANTKISKKPKNYIKKIIIKLDDKSSQTVKNPILNNSYSFYFGINCSYGYGTQTDKKQISKHLFEEYKRDITYSDLGFVFGYGKQRDNKIEVVLSILKKFDVKDDQYEEIFKEGRSIEAGYSFVWSNVFKTFPNTLLFLRLSLGIAQFDIKDSQKSSFNKNSISALEQKISGGFTVLLSNRSEINFAIEKISREFQDIVESSFTTQIEQENIGLNAGFNYRF
jgi:hypothetical protein